MFAFTWIILCHRHQICVYFLLLSALVLNGDLLVAVSWPDGEERWGVVGSLWSRPLFANSAVPWDTMALPAGRWWCQYTILTTLPANSRSYFKIGLWFAYSQIPSLWFFFEGGNLWWICTAQKEMVLFYIRSPRWFIQYSSLQWMAILWEQGTHWSWVVWRRVIPCNDFLICHRRCWEENFPFRCWAGDLPLSLSPGEYRFSIYRLFSFFLSFIKF